MIAGLRSGLVNVDAHVGDWSVDNLLEADLLGRLLFKLFQTVLSVSNV